ncbi:MAG: YtxH domain-containing protein [Actinobacteria bacterium]|nr:YtxH domain-containing protein [Actinomycetota bacterium]
MSDDYSNGYSAFKCGMIGFIIGAAVGAVTALFLTTKTGEELRADLKKAILDIKEKAEEKALKIKDLTKDKYSEIINNVVSNYKKAKEFTQKEIDLIKKIILEQKEL